MNANILNRRLVTCLNSMVLKANLESLSKFKLNENREKIFFEGTSVEAPKYYLSLKLSTK